MTWEKMGLIFNPAVLEKKNLTAALMPIAEVVDEDRGVIRVFFSPRDDKNRSEVHTFDFIIDNPGEVLNITEKSMYSHGKIGTFDDNGITLGSIVQDGSMKYLYYTGWNLTVNVPMNNSIGIAVFNQGIFQRIGDGPIMTRTLHEPYSCASPFVLKENGVFRMWYASMDKWEETPDGLRHYYNIKYCESVDGIHWNRQGHVAVNYENELEYAFGRPFVLHENGVYKMWYAFRGDFYTIGYAESRDGVQWTRKDAEAGIKVSESGWDSEMIEYPYIFDCRNERYMLYNGNGYGKSGIGLARLVS